MKWKIDRSEVRDSLVTVVCVSALVLVLIALWKLGAPLVLLVIALVSTCLIACFAFVHIQGRETKRNNELVNEGKGRQWKARGEDNG
ncbi:MAG: hypothetical protein ACE5IO_00890 [Thermoplasmata archaeon]